MRSRSAAESWSGREKALETVIGLTPTRSATVRIVTRATSTRVNEFTADRSVRRAVPGGGDRARRPLQHRGQRDPGAAHRVRHRPNRAGPVVGPVLELARDELGGDEAGDWQVPHHVLLEL